MKLLNNSVKLILPLLVLAVAFVIARGLIANKPEPVSRPSFKSVTSIDATRVAKSDYQVTLKTQGTVGAARTGTLIAQVRGTVMDVSPNLVSGGFFEQGETLLELDPRDYEIALTMAEATRAQAQAALQEEQARAEQAALDWKRLGRKGKPSSLTLREPQLVSATAVLASADAQIQRAQLDLERTKITAPYSGRVSSSNADLGQFVNAGSVLAEIYSVDRAEVRLPLSNLQLGYLALPGRDALDEPVKVVLSSSIGDQRHDWPAEIVRTEGTIDPNSRQLFAIASVEQPYAVGDKPPLRVGQYVQAAVSGTVLKDVVVIPRSALREDREVLVVDDTNTLQRREVQVRWKDADVAVIGAGLEDGEIISLTSLGTVVNGTRVNATVDGVPSNSEQQAGGQRGGGGDMPERLKRLKATIDAGQDIPPPARERIAARIAEGQPVPNWLKAYMAKQATTNQ